MNARSSTVAAAIAGIAVAALVGAACGGPSSSRSDADRTRSPATVPATPGRPGPERYDPYAGTAAAVPAVGSTTEGRIRTTDGRDRRYRLYVPAALPRGAVPLLVALHGGLGSSAQFATNSGFDGLAEANGFVVVYPDGVGGLADGTGPQTWNGGYCCGAASRLGVDDVGFVGALLDTLARDLPIDPARIFAAGHSNGAILAYRLACELGDRIAAIGVQAGSLGVDTCTPARPVSVFHLHGTADTNHPIEGGTGSGVAGVAFRPARAAVEALAAADGCTPTPVPGTDPANPDLAVTTWTGCRAGTAVRLIAVTGASHAWMGRAAASPGAAALVGEPYPRLDASRAIWSFLAAHPRR
jgi:polyhydroxybutyrate depolymerase